MKTVSLFFGEHEAMRFDDFMTILNQARVRFAPRLIDFQPMEDGVKLTLVADNGVEWWDYADRLWLDQIKEKKFISFWQRDGWEKENIHNGSDTK